MRAVRDGISLRVAAERTGLSHRVVERCILLGIVQEPLDDAELAELRRIRRLHELGVNLAGIQVIMHMRRRINELQAELERRADPWAATEEIEVRNLMHRLLTWRPDEDR